MRRVPCNSLLNDSRQLLEGGEDGVEFAGAEGAEDLGFEVAHGGGGGGESGQRFFARGFDDDDAVVFAHGPEEFDNADAELAGHFLGGSGPFDRVDDVADSLVGVLEQQDVASHRVASFKVESQFSHNRRLIRNHFRIGNLCRANWADNSGKDGRLTDVMSALPIITGGE